MSNYKSGVASDFISLILISGALILASFLSNNGNIRLLSIPVLLVGFVASIGLFRRFWVLLFVCAVYIIKRIFEIAFIPIVFVLKLIAVVIGKCFTVIKKRYDAILIAKYTEKRYKDLEIVRQNGLLDHDV